MPLFEMKIYSSSYDYIQMDVVLVIPQILPLLKSNQKSRFILYVKAPKFLTADN